MLSVVAPPADQDTAHPSPVAGSLPVPDPQEASGVSPLAWVIPNRLFGCCLVAVVALEATALAVLPESLYREGWRVTLLAGLLGLWFWWTVLWGIWLGGTLEQKLRPALPRIAAQVFRGAGLTLVFALLLLYLMSWGLYLHTSRFANLESLLFAVENGRTSWFWLYLLQSERSQLIGCLVGVVGGAVALPWLLGALVRPAAPAFGTVRGVRRFLLWGFCSCLILLAPFHLIANNQSLRHARRDMELDQLKNRLTPGLTLACSLFDSLRDESIEPCLEDEDLRLLRQPAPVDLPATNRPSVIVVAIESLRPDIVGQIHQGREVAPHITRLARGGLHLTRAYSQSTHSDYADVCILSSLYPLRKRRHHYYRAGDPWPRTLLHDVLKPHGYATAIISSQNEAWGGMDRFLSTPNLDLLLDARSPEAPTIAYGGDTGTEMAVRSGEIKNGSLDDAYTVGKAIEWITGQSQAGRPFFLGMNLQSSHFPYELSRSTPRPFQPCAMDFPASFLHYPREKTEVVRNAYLNAVHNCDHQVGRLVEALRRLGRLDNTILVVLGENGEAFHENGIVTHARQPMEPALRVACVLHAPDRLRPRVEDYPTELIDVAPTVLGLMGLSIPENFQGRDILASSRPRLEERLLFFHVENAAVRADAVLLGGRWKLHLDRHTGRTLLFDVIQDPGETTDRSGEQPELSQRLEQVLRTWRRRQLAYYHFPAYYQRAYPPSPPRWSESSSLD